MPTITSIKDGLGTRLRTISGLRVHGQFQDSYNEFPVAVISVVSIDYQQAVGGYGFQGTLRVTVLTGRQEREDAYDMIDDFLDSTGTRSINGAVADGATLTGQVDGSYVAAAENVGLREVGGGIYVGADFLIPFWKKV